MSKVDEAFERYCIKEGIKSEQFKGDIKPAFEAGYRSGAAKQGNLETQIALLEKQLAAAQQQAYLDSWDKNPDRMGS